MSLLINNQYSVKTKTQPPGNKTQTKMQPTIDIKASRNNISTIISSRSKGEKQRRESKKRDGSTMGEAVASDSRKESDVLS